MILLKGFTKKKISIATTIPLSILVIIFASINITTIDAGEKGIHLRNGDIVRIVDAGLYFKLPFIDSIEVISTRTTNRSFNDLSTYSKDQQPAKINISVTYKIPSAEVEQVYRNFKDEESLTANTIDRQVPNQLENVFGRYSAIEAVQKRAEFTKEVEKEIRASLEAYPIEIESAQIENIDFSDAYEASVEARMKAEVEVETQKQNLEKEKISASIKITQAQALADSTLAQATAEAKSVILKGEAEAKAIKIKTEALKTNASLIELTKAEKWNGQLPTTMIPSSSVPFLGIK